MILPQCAFLEGMKDGLTFMKIPWQPRNTSEPLSFGYSSAGKRWIHLGCLRRVESDGEKSHSFSPLVGASSRPDFMELNGHRDFIRELFNLRLANAHGFKDGQKGAPPSGWALLRLQEKSGAPQKWYVGYAVDGVPSLESLPTNTCIN